MAYFRRHPDILVLTRKETQDLLRQEYIARRVELGLMTEEQAETIKDAQMTLIPMEDGHFGIMLTPVAVDPLEGQQGASTFSNS